MALQGLTSVPYLSNSAATVLCQFHLHLHLPAAARSLYKVHEEDGKPFELEISWICEESGRLHQRVPADVAADAERHAKAALEDSDM